MPKYAVIFSGVVENVILAASPPTIALRTIVDVTALTVGPGDSYNGSVFTPRIPSAREIAFGGVADKLRAQYPVLRQWATDAQATYDLATTGNRALTAAEQREFIRRMGRLLDGMADLLLSLNLDS